MSVTINRTVVITEANGNTIRVSGNDKITQETDVVLVCDSSRCAARQGLDRPTTVKWNEEQAKADPMKIPAELFGFIKAIVNVENGQIREVSFCCPSCMKDFLTYEYVPVGRPKLPEPPPLTAEQLTGTPTPADLDASVTGEHPLVPAGD